MYNFSKQMKNLCHSITFNLIYFMYLNGLNIYLFAGNNKTHLKLWKSNIRKSYEMIFFTNKFTYIY